jgi:hypothetical protein
MPDIEFFFDPMCPFAWITSRWVEEVRSQRDVDVEWRFISLAILNQANMEQLDADLAAGRTPAFPPQYRELVGHGSRLLRVAAAVREQGGNDAVARFYTAAGELLHPGGRSGVLWEGGDPGDLVGDTLASAGLSADLAAAADDPDRDSIVAEETELALSRTGRDVGTPIITWDPQRAEESSLFGPVISRIPRGDEALRLWDAMETVANTPGIAEFKRSQRAALDFS